MGWGEKERERGHTGKKKIKQLKYSEKECSDIINSKNKRIVYKNQS